VLDGTLDRVELIGPTPRWRINDDEALELAA